MIEREESMSLAATMYYLQNYLMDATRVDSPPVSPLRVRRR